MGALLSTHHIDAMIPEVALVMPEHIATALSRLGTQSGKESETLDLIGALLTISTSCQQCAVH